MRRAPEADIGTCQRGRLPGQGRRERPLGDQHFQAGTKASVQATVGQRAFTRIWNSLATEYGLATYQQGEL